MDLKPTKPLSGFIELLPAQQRCFDFCAARMLSVLKISIVIQTPSFQLFLHTDIQALLPVIFPNRVSYKLHHIS